jgi:hypothetical protein
MAALPDAPDSGTFGPWCKTTTSGRSSITRVTFSRNACSGFCSLELFPMIPDADAQAVQDPHLAIQQINTRFRSPFFPVRQSTLLPLVGAGDNDLADFIVDGQCRNVGDGLRLAKGAGSSARSTWPRRRSEPQLAFVGQQVIRKLLQEAFE